MKSIFKNSWLLAFIILLLMIGVLGVTPPPAYAAGTITVNNTTDGALVDLAGNGFCDLREAVLAANSDAVVDTCPAGSGDDTILFDASLSGATIHLASTLDIFQTVTIDGSSLGTPVTISGDSDNNGTGDVRVVSTTSPDIFNRTITLDSLIITKGLVSGSGPAGEGAGLLAGEDTTVNIVNSLVSGNSASNGGALSIYGTANIIESTFSGNSSTSGAGGGGAILNSQVLTIDRSTFTNNSANGGSGSGGALYNTSPNATITNSTFSGNYADFAGGAIITTNALTIINSTLSGNEAYEGTGGGISIQGNTTNLVNTIVANSTSHTLDMTLDPAGDCVNFATIGTNLNNLIEDGSCSPSVSGDPNLGALADNGGPTQTMALLPGSLAVNAGDNANCPAEDQRGMTRPQGAHCDIGAFEYGSADIQVDIAGSSVDNYNLPPQSSIRVGYAGQDNGPVEVLSPNDILILSSLRVIWKEPGYRSSYSEMMGLPKESLSSEYWFPWYNNLATNSMDQGFRIANVDSASNTVEVWVGGSQLDTITLDPGASVRVSYNVDNGPARIVCTSCSNTGTDKVIASLRVIWKEPGYRSSYSEMMGLPTEQLSSQYWFPWYNNAVPTSMDQGFRIANVDSSNNTVEVRVGNSVLDTITLNPGASVRVGYNIDNGPVRILCTSCSNTGTDKIIAAMRVIWKEPGYRSSYSEMMGLPTEQLSTQYWFPWYNNATTSMDQGFRIANVDSSDHIIQVWVGSTQLDSFTLNAAASLRKSYTVDNGPVRIVCTDCSTSGKILAALRVIWTEPGYRSSYSEMMGLPTEQLSTEYWFPWYNNAVPTSMDQGFRISVP